MKAALIPPIPSLPYFGRGDFHLLLSHLMDNPEYWFHYKRERERGAYLTLDNSAHENGAGDDPEKLMFKACQIGAQELVVPDVLDDADATIEGALTAHETWFEKRPSPTDTVRQMAFMYVPQGKNRDEWVVCLNNLIRIHIHTSKRYGLKSSFVIGVSKDYEVWDGGLMYLLDEYLVPMRQKLIRSDIRMHCHMLGWGRKLWDLAEIERKHQWIRSTDSAKPFVYALKHIFLPEHLEGSPPEYPKRPSDYFDTMMTAKQVKIAYDNVDLFKAIAEGRQVL